MMSNPDIAISNKTTSSNLVRRRIFAAIVHLGISALVALLLAVIVFGLWYPDPQRSMVGGVELFMLVVAVDVIMGPLLTAVVFNPVKTRAHLARDLAVIGVMQLAALAYGAHTVWAARPAILAFEIDRYRVVTAADVDAQSLQEAPEQLRSLSLGGPRIVSATKPADPAAQLRSMELSTSGFDLGMQPFAWRPFDETQRNAMWKAAQPLDVLLTSLNQSKGLSEVKEAIAKAERGGHPKTKLRYLPIVYKNLFWTALVIESGEIVGYAAVDPFIK